MAVVEALVRGRADPSKFYEPRGNTDRSRLVTFGERKEEGGEENSLQNDHTERVTNCSANDEQDTDGHISTLASELSTMDLRLTAGDSDRSSSTTEGN